MSENSREGKASINVTKPSVFEKFVPALVVICVALAFLVGVLWQKVENIGKGNTTGTADTVQQGTGESPISVDNLKKIAKKLDLNTNDFNKCLDSGSKADVVKKDSDYGGTVGVSGTPAFFINGRFLGGAYPFASFKEVIDRELDGKGSDDYKTYSKDLQDAAEQKDQAGNPSPSFIAVAKNIDTSNSPVLGNNDAKVIIVEFTDFECPYCIRHFTQTWPDIKKNYIDTNKVKLIVKNYPLPFHPNAQKAAEAAECASDQGKYWEMHDAIFSAK